jgi:S-DNA-T family DNA segregation ATPase FtsK/SpoIIIE
VALWGIDPKGGLELAIGEPLFARLEDASYAGMADLLELAVERMDERTRTIRGVARSHTPTTTDPVIVIIVDELATLTAYLPDNTLKKRITGALALLLSKGRAVGVHVVAAVQDPRKDIVALRDLFPTRIALRLTESSHVDMVLGDGARDRGALADLIAETAPGTAYVVVDGSREVTRVRAGYHSDDEIRAMARAYASPFRPESAPGDTAWVLDLPSQRNGGAR